MVMIGLEGFAFHLHEAYVSGTTSIPLLVVSVIFLVVGLLGLKLTIDWLAEALAFADRFHREWHLATQELAIYEDPQDIERCAERSFLDILAHADEIKQTYLDRTEDTVWCSYLTRRGAEGGYTILRHYELDYNLLAASKRIFFAMTDADLARHREEIKVAEVETRVLGNLDIQNEQRRRLIELYGDDGKAMPIFDPFEPPDDDDTDA
jgi:hypothetical protein